MIRYIGTSTTSVQARWYTFFVIGVVIVIDVSRTVVLWRASRLYRSPALADDVTEQPGQGVLAVHGPGAVVGRGRPLGLRRQRHVFFLFQRRVPRTLDSLRPR